MVSLVLQNVLKTKSRDSYTPVGFTDQIAVNGNTVERIWRESAASLNFAPLQTSRKGRVNSKAEKIRKTFCNHFNIPDQVPWQWSVLNKCTIFLLIFTN